MFPPGGLRVLAIVPASSQVKRHQLGLLKANLKCSLFGEICTRMQITNQEKILTDKFFKPPCKQGAAALYKVQTRLIFMAQVVCLFYLQ